MRQIIIAVLGRNRIEHRLRASRARRRHAGTAPMNTKAPASSLTLDRLVSRCFCWWTLEQGYLGRLLA